MMHWAAAATARQRMYLKAEAVCLHRQVDIAVVQVDQLDSIPAPLEE